MEALGKSNSLLLPPSRPCTTACVHGVCTPMDVSCGKPSGALCGVTSHA